MPGILIFFGGVIPKRNFYSGGSLKKRKIITRFFRKFLKYGSKKKKTKNAPGHRVIFFDFDGT